MGRIRNHFTRKNPKVSASSLVETIVATVIIMIVFGIAMSSMLGVVKQTTENQYKKNTFVYDFLSSMRQKINDPLGKRKR